MSIFDLIDAPFKPSRLVEPITTEAVTCHEDLPHIRLLIWLMQSQPHGRPLPLDREKIGKDCQLSGQETREAIARLVREGDLEPSTGRGPERFTFRVQYHDT
jgi:hypothetical protein